MRFHPKRLAAALFFALCCASCVAAQAAPDSSFRRAAPVTLAELKTLKTSGVSVAEVSDYVFGNYAGDFKSPPHADINPKKAFVIYWRDFPFRFVFSHEASYCPWFELPDGVALSYQFFEGNDGWAELFNDYGRKERNSYVDIIESGPRRVWVRWTYTGVNMESGVAAFRGTEDFWAFPNGLVLRRQSYESLMPGDKRGYAREPIELIAMEPVGKLWFDVLGRDPSTGESHAFVGLDAFSKARADIYWTRQPKPGKPFTSTARRTGSAWKELDDARGFAGIIPFREGSPFFVVGDASGYPHETTRMKEHSDKATGGWGWRSLTWDHWPVGWLNSQAHDTDNESYKKYPSHFAPFGLDLWSMKNEETERRDFYSLMGVGGSDVEAVRTLAREWLTRGPTDPARAATLRPLRHTARGK
ncbi:MAG TPA: hypothetical protein VGP08_20015 [Pyrinomonadaceae bacterium]|jgi:hypothetical protein|nr:hypothetical protein [Pyrinomonadaceae bacterium]